MLYDYVLNQQGGVMALMNTSGAIVAEYQYDPRGVPPVQSSSGNRCYRGCRCQVVVAATKALNWVKRSAIRVVFTFIQ